MIGFRNLLTASALILLAYLWRDSPGVIPIQENLDDEYDYIIVGSGSAGCVLASRLSEDPSVSVLLLEAGGEAAKHAADIDVPYRALALMAGDELVWQDATTPQQHACQGMTGKPCLLDTLFAAQRCRLARARVLGGSSSVGCMTHSRASRHDYDGWAAGGASGWGYSDIQPYFDVDGHSNSSDTAGGESQRSRIGPIVSNVHSTSLSEAFVIAGQEQGYTLLTNDTTTHLGITPTRATTKNGRRISSARAYLAPAAGRANLHIATHSLVQKILFDHKKVVGVEVSRDGVTATRVKSRREVIVSAGAIGSAHLLLLSGIGPKDHLKEFNIAVVADLPVGDNLQDHLGVVSSEYTLKEPIAITEFKAASFWAALDYFIFGTGFLGSPCHQEGVAFLRSSVPDESGGARGDSSPPDVQIQLLNTLIGNSASLVERYTRLSNIEPQIAHALHGGVDLLDGFSLMPVLLQPRSRGTVRLSSAKPADRPIIDPGFLSDPRDLKVFIEGIRQSERLLETNMLRALGPRPLARVHPACAAHASGTDAYWDCFVRHNAFSLSHTAGTCRMGSDSGSVVDTQLRVRGVSGLRVVDASIMPRIVSANTNAAIVMIAERASDLITGRVRS